MERLNSYPLKRGLFSEEYYVAIERLTVYCIFFSYEIETFGKVNPFSSPGRNHFPYCRKKHLALFNVFQNGYDPDVCRNVAHYGNLKWQKDDM